MSAQPIAQKWRRALRKGTGLKLTQDQLRELTEYGYLHDLAQREAEELCPAKTAPTAATRTGSTNAAMAAPASGRSPDTKAGRSYIEALAN
tara:strand:- start:1143 stop:1415 length:273 start_codon:yes stop_codon:yes gene_type:complete